jgi:hypothetical protein
MLLVAVLVVAITGFAIYRLHGIFGSHTNTSANAGLSNEIVPFNPKQVILEVFGAPGSDGARQTAVPCGRAGFTPVDHGAGLCDSGVGGLLRGGEDVVDLVLAGGCDGH